MSAGVPQGSILGPVLFLMFIDDLASHLEKDIHLFADDSTLHIAITNTCDRIICAESLQCDLNKIEAWADSWCVTFNASKTEEMIISRKRSQNHPPLHFMNKELQPTDSITLLGVTITKTLSWSQHITCIAIKTAKRLYISWAVLETSFLTKLVSPSTRLTSDLLWNMQLSRSYIFEVVR